MDRKTFEEFLNRFSREEKVEMIDFMQRLLKKTTIKSLIEKKHLALQNNCYNKSEAELYH
jgi:hypothetical protein